ncbi:hypothetical protein [Variovorax paradoxus]|uniref:hypothetical protein n=1 Tax=Variovorax paradoxus TaxID=34073 RepID=UPI0024819143|nr:hypothetical protein [Variovorax paradoxus]WGT64974.1 hypothetical protein QHG62_06430 [Variovorax paradoxus]
MSAAEHTAFKLPPLNDDMREILGRPNFACARIAEVLRIGGADIACKAEAEQAAAIHWMLSLYGAHGPDWWTHCRCELQTILESSKACEEEGGAA